MASRITIRPASRVCEMKISALVHAFDDGEVLLVAAVSPKADKGQRYVHEFPVWVRLDPGGEIVCQPNTAADELLDPGPPEAAHRGPELERTEAAAECGSVVRQVRGFVVGAQVLGNDRECLPQR